MIDHPAIEALKRLRREWRRGAAKADRYFRPATAAALRSCADAITRELKKLREESNSGR